MTPEERKAYYEEPTRFTVNGKGTFPADMLRHDHCYPVDGDINCITDRRLSGGQGVSVVLVAPTRGHITPRRWASFGWIVTDIAGQETF